MPMETRSSRTTTRTIPEETLLEIVARLPLRSIARFRSVCKTWKSVIESSYFRRLFVSLHKSSSSSWSLMFPTDYLRPIAEAIGFHGCETWGLPKSLGSYILSFGRYQDLSTFRCFYIASSNGLIWINASARTEKMAPIHKSFVGNPVLQQWVEIPPPPEPCIATGLVTRVDEDGLVSSFKVVRTCQRMESDNMGMYEWRVNVYSSETGLWTSKRLLSSHPLNRTISYYHPVNLNGMLYLWGRRLDPTEPGLLIAHDFYGPEADDQCRIIPLPLPYNKHVRRCFTTSGGNVIYIELLDRRLKVWRLNNNNNSGSSECWHLSRGETNLASVGFDVDCFPMAMNPLDSDIVYLWSRQHNCLVSGNLQTQKFMFHKKSMGCSSSEGCYRVNRLESKGYMEGMHDPSRVLMLSQFVLPRWMDSVPHLPN